MTIADDDDLKRAGKPLPWGGTPIAGVDGLAVLRAITGKADIVALYRDAGRLAAAVTATAEQPLEVDAIIALLAAQKGLTTDANKLLSTLRRAVRKREATLRVLQPGERDVVELADILDWPDYPPGVVVPPGYAVREKTLYRITADGELPVGALVLVTRRLVDCDTREWMIELAWWDRTWRVLVLPREVALDARALVGTAKRGVPVASTSSRHLVAWIAALDQQEAMPTDWCSARMGWVGTRDEHFLLGEQALSTEDDNSVVLTAEGGGRQLAEAYRTEGTWAGWLDTIALVGNYPSAYAAIYVAASAPLLKLLGAPSYGVDWVGQSGTGKTTSLRLGASVGAQPVVGAGMRSWSASLPGLEASAAISCDLPLCIDEGQLVPPARYAEAGTWLYGLINGAGKTRGALGRLGQQRVESWRIALLSTSEVGITRWSPYDGARARIIELRGYPLGDGNAALAEEVERRLLRNYGHLMPRLVDHLLRLDKYGRARLRDGYAEIVAELGELATSPVARRTARVIGAVAVASTVLHDFLGVPRPPVDVGAWLWSQVQDVSEEGDRPKAAMQAALDWAWSLRHQFQAGPKDQPPHGAWLGLWLDDGARIAVVPETLDKVLIKAGFPEPKAIYAEWKRREWIECEAGRFVKKVRLPAAISRLSTPERYVVLRGTALDTDE